MMYCYCIGCLLAYWSVNFMEVVDIATCCIAHFYHFVAKVGRCIGVVDIHC